MWNSTNPSWFQAQNILIFLYAAMGMYLHENSGTYRSTVWIYFILFLVALAMLYRQEWRTPPQQTAHQQEITWSLLLVFFCCLLSYEPKLLYLDRPFWRAVLSIVNSFMVVGSMVCTFCLLKKPKAFWPSLIVLAVMATSTQFMTLVVSPEPHIDVFVNNSAAAEFFLQGKNPYRQNYQDIYPQGAYDYRAGFLYFPGTLYWIAPFKFLGDIRLGFVLANLLAAWGIFSLATHAGGRRAVGALAAVAWLCFPLSYFVIEQAWTDPLIVALSVWSIFNLTQKKLYSASILLGLLCLYKQYAFVVAFFGLLWIFKCYGFTRAVKSGLVLLTVFVVGVLPFVILDFQSIYFWTMQNQIFPGTRLDALTLTAYLAKEWSWGPSKNLSLFATAGTAAATSLFVLAKRTTDIRSILISILATYGMAFLLGKWAFANYHFLLAAFALLCLVLPPNFAAPTKQKAAHLTE